MTKLICKLRWILWALVEIRWKLLNFLEQDSNEKLSDVGKVQNNRESDRNPDTPILSDIERITIGFFSQGFCRNFRNPIESY